MLEMTERPVVAAGESTELMPPGEPLPPGAPHALVVDDSATNRLILSSILGRMGYRVTECHDGLAAVAACVEQAFDIILMDVMMPVMDGIAAVRLIRGTTPQRYTPVIFLTALADEATVEACLDAGGDDFLGKPYNHAVLRLKITALRRAQQLQDRVAGLHAQQLQDEQFAETLFSRAVHVGNYRSPAIDKRLRPATRFSGDVCLTARAPSGEIYVLLGDFTGHGLGAAIGALPVSEVFRAMTAKGFAPGQILRAIDRKLHALFPTGLFMAAQFVAVDPSLRFLRVANCGMPDVHVFQPGASEPVTAIVAHSVALGISPDLFLSDDLRTVHIAPGARVLLASDGLLEAEAADGRAYGSARMLAAMHGGLAQDGHGLARVFEDLDRFCDGTPQVDDITAVEIRCDDSLLEGTSMDAGAAPSNASTGTAGTWEVQCTLRGQRLARVDPVPLLMNQVAEMRGNPLQDSGLFTVLTELFVNALDHGVLALPSALKSGPRGFEYYMQERARRLGGLADGWVRIEVAQVADGDETIHITVSDSGRGFDVTLLDCGASTQDGADTARSYGRGFALVRALCSEVDVPSPGNVVRVAYRTRVTA